jgi:hypothetical protein
VIATPGAPSTQKIGIWASPSKWQLKKASLQNKSQWVNSILGHNPMRPNEINFRILASLQTSLGSRTLALNYPKIKA